MTVIEGRILACDPGVDGRIVVEAFISSSEALEMRPEREVRIRLIAPELLSDG